MTSINWAELLEETKSDDKLLDAGPYVGTIVYAKVNSSQRGNEYLRIGFRPDGINQPVVYSNITFAPDNSKAMNMFFSKMQALGVGRLWFAANPGATLHELANEVLGRGTKVEVCVEEYNGQVRNNISRYFSYVPAGLS